ncbi:MAG: hypothetical protein V4857_03375 [Pseudomonadota bacterium]
MISVIPSLDFMHSLCGTYKAVEGHAELRVWTCGYGVALDLRGAKKTEFVGVVGAFKTFVECYAQIGLPNVVRFVGEKKSDFIILFTGEDVPLSMELSRENGLVSVTISLSGKEKVYHVMRAA